MGCGNTKSSVAGQDTFLGPATGVPSDPREKDNTGSNRRKSISASRLQAMSDSKKGGESGVTFDVVDEPKDGGKLNLSANNSDLTKRRLSRRASLNALNKRRLSGALNEFGNELQSFLKSTMDTPGPIVSPKDATKEVPQEVLLRKMFDSLDVDGTDEVTVDLLIAGFKKMGYTRTDKQLKQMFIMADRGGSGKIDWKQFHTFFKCLPYASVASGEEADEALRNALRNAGNTSVLRTVHGIRGYSLRFLIGCNDRVKSIAVNSKRGLLATASRTDKCLRLTSIKSGVVQRHVEGHEGAIMQVAFCPCNKVVGSSGRDNVLILWDCTVGHELETLPHAGIVTCVSFSPDGVYVYTGCQDNYVRRFTIRRGKEVARSESTKDRGVVVVLAVPRNDTVPLIAISRSCDKGARILDATTLRFVRLLSGHSTMVWFCSFSTSAIFATACEKIVNVWNASEGTLLRKFEVCETLKRSPTDITIWTCCVFCPAEFDGTLMVASSDKVAHFLSINTGEITLSVQLRAATFTAAVDHTDNDMYLGDDMGNIAVITLS